LAFFPSTSRAATFVAFGPQQYVRATGQPVSVKNTFTVLDRNTTYSIRIDSTGVSSAIVTLNGTVIFNESDFNANVSLLTKPVTLVGTNQLSVELRGKPGESFTLQVIGVDNVLPTITANLTPTPNAAGWNKSNVIVAFSCSDATSGIASCSDPVSLSEETAG